MYPVFEGRLPLIDHAVDYTAVPDDGLCPDIPTIILSKYFEYTNDSILLITDVEPLRLLQYIELIYLRCNELRRYIEEDAEAYGIDHLLFHPKSIFYAQRPNSTERLAAWLATLDPYDPYTLGLCCRKDPRMNKIIVPIIYQAPERGGYSVCHTV